MKKQFTKTNKNNNLTFSKATLTSVLVMFGVVFFSMPTFAQQVATVPAEDNSMGINQVIIFLLLCTTVLLLVTILLFVRTRRVIAMGGQGAQEPSFLDRFNASVSIEHEADILMDHDYDGIKELDNSLPPWWKYGFYLTIVIAICYLTYYHILGGELQVAAYDRSVVEAKAAQEAYQKEHGDMINADNVKLITDKTQLVDAEKTFKTTCFVCHGMNGEGKIGPNLTDDYWIHGGSIKNIFTTITNGWPEKGMQSWKTTFTPLQISQLASYVKSLRGTNPANPKEKQGDLFVEEGSANLAPAIKDSTSTAPKDSVKIVK